MKISNKIACKIGAHYDGVYKLERRTKKELIADLLELYEILLATNKEGK